MAFLRMGNMSGTKLPLLGGVCRGGSASLEVVRPGSRCGLGVV